jgi:hypothetical protein
MIFLIMVSLAAFEEITLAFVWRTQSSARPLKIELISYLLKVMVATAAHTLGTWGSRINPIQDFGRIIDTVRRRIVVCSF